MNSIGDSLFLFFTLLASNVCILLILCWVQHIELPQKLDPIIWESAFMMVGVTQGFSIIDLLINFLTKHNSK